MNAVEFLNTQEEEVLIKLDVESAYQMYLAQTDDPSSGAFFKAKFNARRRKIEKVIPVKDEVDEIPESNKLEVGPTVITKTEVDITEGQVIPVKSEEVQEMDDDLVEITAHVETDEEYNARVADIEGEKEEIDTIDFSSISKEDISKLSNKDYAEYEKFLRGPKVEIESIKKKPCPTAQMIASTMENSKTDYYEGDPEEVEKVEYEKTKVKAIEDDEVSVLEIVNYRDGKELPDLPGLIPTGTIFDRIVCDRVTSDDDKTIIPANEWERGGFTRKCCDVVAGGAGSGKTFSRTMLACMAKQINPSLRIGFISAEMREVEWVKEVKSAPILADLEVVYMLNYVGQPNYEELFYEAISMFDIVIVDSFPAIISHIKMAPKEKRTDKAITFDLIREINLSVDKYNYNMQLINQATKDGNYKGGTELPHMMSSQSFVRVDGQKRYMEFEKNRNNGQTIRRKVYFTKNTTTGLLEFDVEVYTATYETVEDTKQSLAEFFQTVQERVEVAEEEDSSIIDNNQVDLEDMIDEVEQEQELETVNL